MFPLVNPKLSNAPSTDSSSRFYGSARARSELPSSEALRSSLSLSLLAREFPGWSRRSVLCYALLRDATHFERRPAFLWPGRLVTGLRGSVQGTEQGLEGVFGRSVGRPIRLSMPRATLLFLASRALCEVDDVCRMDERVDPIPLRPWRRAAREEL